MIRWLGRKLLTIKYVLQKDGVTIKAELRFLGFKVGRVTYCRIGRWFGKNMGSK